MTEERIVATGEDRSHPSTPQADSAHAKCIDATVQDMKATGFYAPLDRSCAEAGSEQLAPRDHTVLISCEIRELALARLPSISL